MTKCPYCLNGLVTTDSGASVNCGHTFKLRDHQLADLVSYIDKYFVSGNDRPVTTILFSKDVWDVIKEFLRDDLPLDYHVVESEAVYRRKQAVYGDELRAKSPLAAYKATRKGEI